MTQPPADTENPTQTNAQFGAASLVDTHAHLCHHRLRNDLEAVLKHAARAGVGWILSAATTAEDSTQTLEIAEKHAGLSGAVAIHPNEAGEATGDDWDRIVELASRPGVAAIGETGLDRYWDKAPFSVQQDYFDRHLDLARQRNLAVIIHCRDCYPDVIAQLERQPRPLQGVLHSFTGTWDDAQALLELGLYLSFAGMITFENKALNPLREVATRVPTGRLLVETDSPYLSPHPYRGKPNEPARVALTAARIAELRGMTPGELAAATTANAHRLFRLSPDPLDA